MAQAFTYSNINHRPKSLWLRLGTRFIRSIRLVQAQERPYAEAWQSANRRALQQSGPLWVVLGDSMSQGLGASSYDHGWVGQAAQLLRARGRNYRIVNLSVSGARLEDVIRTQLPALERLGLRPQLVTVMIGSNDLIAPRYRRQLLTHLARLLQALPPGTVVADIFRRPDLQRPSGADAVTPSQLLERVACQRGLVVADLGAAFRPPWNGKLAADLFHPNDRGYTAIAKEFVKTLETLH